MAPARVVRSLVYLVTLVAAGPVAAQRGQDGALVGTVVDTSGAALVGATVTATSPQQIGGPRTVVSDTSGRYRFPALAPGEYAIEGSLQGFKPTRVEAVLIPPGLAISVDLPLALDSVAEAVVVTRRPAPIDVRSASSPASLDRVLIDTLPLSRDVHTYVNLVPGVTEAVAFGGSVRANPFTVDGASGNEPGWGAATTPFARTWMEEVQFVGLGASAEFGESTGLAVNALTRSGGDRFSGLGEYRLTHQSWTGDNRGDLPPAQADAFRPLEVVERWEAIGQGGGPLRRERLWFFAGAQHYRDDTRAVAFGTGPRSADEPVPRSTNRRAIGKLTGAVTTAGRVEAFASRNHRIADNQNAGPLVSPEATTFDDRTDDLWNVRVSWTTGARWLFEARHGGNHRDGVAGAAADRRDGPPARYDVLTGAYSVNASFYDRWDSWGHTTAGAATGYLGNHEVRIGIEHERAGVVEARTQPGGLFYLDYGGQPYQVSIWDGATFRGRHHRTSLFAQDTWARGPVTVEAGLRLGVYRATPPYAALYRTHGLAPRLGAAWDVGGRHQTVLRAHYGRYHDPMVTSYYDFLDPLAWAPEITADVVGPGQFVEVFRFLPTTGLAIDPDLRPSYVGELVAGVERALPGQLALRAQVVDRRFEDTVSFIDTATRWEPVTQQDPGPDGRAGTEDDGGVLTLYNNANPGAAFRVLTNPPQAYRRYRAAQVVIARRATRGPTFQVSYTWSRTRGNFNNGFSSNAANADNSVNGVFVNPNRALNREGPTAFDFTHSFKSLASWRLPGGWTLSGIHRLESGRRWARNVTFRTGLNQGFETVLVEPFVRRTPTVNVADIRVEKTVQFAGTTAGIYGDLFNVANAGVARTYIAQSGALFGQPSSWLEPRTLTVGLRLQF